MSINLELIKNEVEKFINENVNEFEFIVDINDFSRWELNIDGWGVGISECVNVYFRDIFDSEIRNNLIEGENIYKYICVNGVKMVIIN